MLDTVIITDTRKKFVVLIWDFHEGYRYVGPFADDVHAANTWGAFWEDDISASPCWHTELVDPTAPLPIEAPALLDGLTCATEDPVQFSERLSDIGAFYILQTTGDPPHLVGPFDSHIGAYCWGLRNEALHDTQANLGWQVVWLNDATAPPALLSCEEEEASWPQ